MKILDVGQLDFYRQNGYLLPEINLFTEDEFSRMKRFFEDHLNDRGDKLSDELDTPHFRDPRLFEFLMHEKVLDVVEDILGPDIGLWSSHFISKEPFKGRRTPWHEDSAYWKGKFDRLDQVLTIWLALDESDLENGCMGVIPGSHTHGFSEYEEAGSLKENTFSEEIKQGSFNEEEAVWFQLKPGQFSMHDARIIHGAGPNKSPRRRAGYTMRYFNLSMKFRPDYAPGHKVFHCRGKNQAGNPLVYL